MNDQSQPPQMMTQPPPQHLTLPRQHMPRQHPQMMSYGLWPPPVPPMTYPTNPLNNPLFVGPNPTNPRNWKNKNPKKGGDKRKFDKIAKMGNNGPLNNIGSSGVSGSLYRPPTLNELQNQNRVKAKRFFNPKKKYNNRFAPYAPRNTTSFLIRAKKSGGIASLVSPCPVTPAVLPTPMFSPSREVLGDMAKEEWGVDGYGSMKGLIRLKNGENEENDDNENDESSDSDVEEHVEVERRLDHDLSRFEMINYPSLDYNNVLENRVDDQDTHIAHLEEENLILKERLFLMEREMGDLRRRMGYLERGGGERVGEEINEEVVDNVSDNSESRDDGGFMDNGEEIDGKEYGDNEDVCMEEFVNENVVESQSKTDNVAENESKIGNVGENESKIGNIAENESKINNVAGHESKVENVAENQSKVGNFSENQSKIGNVGEGTSCVEKKAEISDVSMEGVRNVDVEVATEVDELKNVDEKIEN